MPTTPSETANRPPPRAKKELISLAGYQVTPRTGRILLDNNEFRLSLPSSLTDKIFKEFQSIDFQDYPLVDDMDILKTRLADYLNVDPENIFLGVGSNEILDLACRVFGAAGQRIVAPDPSFPMYGHYARLSEREFVQVPLDHGFALTPAVADRLLAVERAGVMYVANPNNPTGTLFDRGIFDRLCSDRGRLVCIDEVYAEYSGTSFSSLAVARDNVLVVRSLSKIGLAACRVGYAVGSRELIQALSKAALPYTLNSVSLRIAIAFMEEMEALRPLIRTIVAERTRLSTALAAIDGITPLPSTANFILCAVQDDAPRLARRLLERHEIAVRSFENAPRLRGHVRITVGSPDQNDALLAALTAETRPPAAP